MSARKVSLQKALMLSLVISAASVNAYAQQVGDRKPVASKPPVAEYDLGIFSRKLRALEGKVAELEKKNAALETQVTAMKLKDSFAAKNPGGISPGGTVPERLKRLEDGLRNHQHYMPNIGIMALNALPGMQEIASKSGMGHVIEQWKGIKMHLSFGAGGGLDRTGAPIPPGQ